MGPAAVPFLPLGASWGLCQRFHCLSPGSPLVSGLVLLFLPPHFPGGFESPGAGLPFPDTALALHVCRVCLRAFRLRFLLRGRFLMGIVCLLLCYWLFLGWCFGPLVPFGQVGLHGLSLWAIFFFLFESRHPWVWEVFHCCLSDLAAVGFARLCFSCWFTFPSFVLCVVVWLRLVLLCFLCSTLHY